MRRRAITWALSGLLACSACGLALCACGDDDDGSGAVQSGLPPNQRLSELDAEQARQACDNVVTGLDAVLTAELLRFRCTLAALPMSISVTLAGQATGDVDKCRNLVSQCVSGGGVADGGLSVPEPDPFGSQMQCASPAATAAVQSCDATVGEYEACLNARVESGRRCLRTLDCSLVADPESVRGVMEPPPPPFPELCVDLDARCPQLGLRSMNVCG